MSLEAFKESEKGAKLKPIFESNVWVNRMVRKSESGRPAVEAIGPEVQSLVGELNDDERKMVGRWAKQVLAPQGLTPDRKGRVTQGNFFTRGTIYRRAEGADAAKAK